MEARAQELQRQIQQGEKTMTTRITTLIYTSTTNILRLALLSSLVLAASLLAVGQDSHEHDSPARLVQLVRDATRQFIDVNAAGPAGYGPAFGCVSRSEERPVE